MTSSGLSLQARKAGLLLDTNLLILYVIGMCDSTRIAKHKRTNQYAADDFRSITEFYEPVSEIYYDAKYSH